MGIRVKPRVFVAPEVLDFYQSMAIQKIRAVMVELKSADRYRRGWLLKKNKVLLAKLAPIARGVREAGKGLDYELARFRALEYERIEMEDEFLVAKTGELKIEQLSEVWEEDLSLRKHPFHYVNKVVGYWDAGPYWIYIPKDDLVCSSIENIHFIPTREPLVVCRHPHHYGYEGDDWRGTENYIRGDVRRVNVNTCWAEFAEPVTGTMQDGDLVELLRMLRIFVGRYYDGSPLKNPDRYFTMSFMTRIRE